MTDTNPPTNPVVPVPDTPPPTTSTTMLISYFHGVKLYNSRYVIDLDKVPSLQWKFTNQFCDPVYLKIDLARMGLCKGYFALDNEKNFDKFAFVWVDRDQRHFISNTSSLKPGLPFARDRLRKVDDIPNADPVCVEFDINQPRVAERYYSRNSKIEESDRKRQGDFQL